MTWSVLNGDCLERLADLDDDSIDAVVTDPPYGLSAEPDAAEVLRHWLDGDDYRHRGGGFMGKTWDSFVPGPTVWKECLRVLKPGGHLVAFFGTRTVDLGGMAIRLAGFEIRDCLAWHYGSGFPKSLDVSKAIDKAAGAERERKWVKASNPKVVGQGHDGVEGASRPYIERALRENNGFHAVAGDTPATDLARQWQGWGTALKPAFEPVILARKPLIGTVAENVTRYGTGALNVDGCRVEYQGESDRPTQEEWNRMGSSGAAGANGFAGQFSQGMKDAYADGKIPVPPGRWPANLILDEEAGAMLDAQSGETRSTEWPTRERHSNNAKILNTGTIHNAYKGGGYADTGGASRFFYQAKASRAEREAGVGALRDSGRGKMAANHHPTVKPIDLMRWLCRLVTPPGGTVLDPFTGSGTTGIAAGLEGFKFVGIEREAEYREIAEARLRWWGEQEGETAEILQRAGLAEKERAKAEAAGQTSLFEEAA